MLDRARFETLAYAALRIVAGFMFLWHGSQKLLGFPASKAPPELFSQMWFGGIIELIGGAMIALGLLTRPAAFLASGTMAVAYIQFHWKGAFGADFLRDPAIDFLRHAGSFSTSRQEHTPLSRLVLEAGADIAHTDIDGRSLRPGTEDISQELLQLMPPSFPRSLLMHRLAVARHRRRRGRRSCTSSRTAAT